MSGGVYAAMLQAESCDIFRSGMMIEISAEMAASIIRRAFFPLHCGVDVYDYGQRVRLNVVSDSNESLLKLTDVTFGEFSDPVRLGLLLEQLRDEIIQGLGVSLEPWTMPSIELLKAEIDGANGH